MGGLGSDPALLQQGSPTLLSALKGSSLRGTYGQDYSQAFKEDDMSALLDFKNPSSRLSLNTLAVDNSDLGGEDELTEALWSSFPGGVGLAAAEQVDAVRSFVRHGRPERTGGPEWERRRRRRGHVRDVFFPRTTVRAAGARPTTSLRTSTRMEAAAAGGTTCTDRCT